MADETTTTTLAELLPKIIQEAWFQAEEQSIMRGLVKNYDLPFASGTTVNVPKYAKQTAADLTEGTDLVNTAISTTEAVLTVKEVGIMATVTDFSRRTSASNVIADIGKLFGEAIARKIDADLAALFSGFATTIGAGSTDTITAAEIFQAAATLRALSVPTDGTVCVLHPEVAYDLKNEITAAGINPNAGPVQNMAMVNGFIGMLAGLPVYENANIVSTAGVSSGAVFHRDALGLANLVDIRIETERDASLRADELVATATYGVGELEDTYGVHMNFDGTIG